MKLHFLIFVSFWELNTLCIVLQITSCSLWVFQRKGIASDKFGRDIHLFLTLLKYIGNIGCLIIY